MHYSAELHICFRNDTYCFAVRKETFSAQFFCVSYFICIFAYLQGKSMYTDIFMEVL